jgi:hypothetical protein
MFKLNTKSLNDGTTGARFDLEIALIGNLKGIYRKRAIKSRGWKIEALKHTYAVHLGKRTLYLESFKAKRSNRRLYSNWAK